MRTKPLTGASAAKTHGVGRDPHWRIELAGDRWSRRSQRPRGDARRGASDLRVQDSRMPRGPAADSDRLVFAFGRNWQRFVDAGIDQGRIDAAVEALRRLLVCDDLRGRTFLDVGCGSGLSSLAALELGAERVLAFDPDPHAVAAARALRAQAGDPGRWQITQGSILDPAFVATLAPADVVYAWGVLHHTGDLWAAIARCAGLVRPGGLLAIAVYNDVTRAIGSSRQWWHVKRFYNRAPAVVQRVLELAVIAERTVRDLAVLRDPRRRWRRRERGMRYRHDVRDWLGGFPYEYASPGRVFAYVHDTCGLELCYLATGEGHVCNEFTFRRR